MANQIVFAMAFCVLLCKDIGLVQSADECRTHADCKRIYSSVYVFCCRTRYPNNERSCQSTSCLYDYCSTESDCGSPSMCCRSNKCVNKGCSGCADDSDCSVGYHCCKKTFPFNQTVCGKNCLNEHCHSNDDCAGWNECCRSGKCVNTGCYSKCTLNSDCNLGEYCCKKKKSWYSLNPGCSKSCVGEICSSDDDCGGPNECCISNKCVTSGCFGCNTTSDCSNEQYCCKKKEWYELSECSADCIGKSCGTNDDCGPGETCDSDNRCTKDQSFPSWVIAVIVASVTVLLIAVGVFAAVFWYCLKVRPTNTTQRNRGTMALQTNQNQGAAIRNPQPNTQISGSTNAMSPHQMAGFQDQPPPYGNEVTQPTQNTTFSPQQTVQISQNQENHNPPPQYTAQQGYENHGFFNPTENVQHLGNPTSTRNATVQDNEVPYFYNQLHNATYPQM